MKIKKGDNVIMLSGKDRGKTGQVLRVSPQEGRVSVGGLNLVKRHRKPRQGNQKGSIVSIERMVSASAVAVVNKDSGKAARVGWQIAGDTKVRIDRKTKTTL